MPPSAPRSPRPIAGATRRRAARASPATTCWPLSARTRRCAPTASAALACSPTCAAGGIGGAPRAHHSAWRRAQPHRPALRLPVSPTLFCQKWCNLRRAETTLLPGRSTESGMLAVRAATCTAASRSRRRDRRWSAPKISPRPNLSTHRWRMSRTSSTPTLRRAGGVSRGHW